MDKIEIKLESLDPTGIAFKTSFVEMELEPDDAMKQDRLFLYVGECLYRINKKGFIIERIIPNEDS